jgi:hypothetical protein
MQQLQTEIYSEVWEMIEDRDFEEMLYGQGRGSSLINFMKIRDLRTFFRATQHKLEELEKDAVSNKEKLLLLGSILEAVKREIQRLERKSLYLEFGFE